jgi:hypothetical protein
MLGRRRAVLLLTLVSLMVVLPAAASAQALVLRAGAHGRANIIDPGQAAPVLPLASPGGIGAAGIAAGLGGLAAVLGLVGIVGRTGWQRGGEDAFARPLAAVPAAPHLHRRDRDRPSSRKAA